MRRPISGGVGGITQAAGDVRYAQLAAANTFTVGPQTISPAANTSAITISSHTNTTSNPSIVVIETWNAGAVVFNAMDFQITNTASANGSAFINFTLGGTVIGGITRPIASAGGGGITLVFGSASSGLPALSMDSGTTMLVVSRNDNAASFLDFKCRHHFVDATMTAGGTTGNQTINKAAGSVNIAAAGTTVTVTNSLVAATSIVIPVVMTNDTTALVKNCVVNVAGGSFVITMNAAVTAETKIGFYVIN